MKRQLVDCGFIVAVLELSDDGKPMLTLLQPATDGEEGQTLVIWDTEGIEALREGLAEFLDDWAAANAAEGLLMCSICGKEIKDSDSSVGTGKGGGKSFAHLHCYRERQEITPGD